MKITLKQFLAKDGRSLLEILEEATLDSVAPALCDEFCEVEPDGTCEHGAPSILIACGMI